MLCILNWYARPVELRHLRYFVAAAEEENITRAAARLCVSQPPLSRQIRDLERELGVQLFHRSAKAIRLTEAGRIFLLEARSTLHRADEAVAAVKAVTLGKRGRLRIGYAASPTVEILPRILRLFRRTHPQITVDLCDLSTQGMLRGLKDRTLDAILTVSISPQDFAGLTVHELGSYPVRVAVHRKHKFARWREVRLGDMAAEPMVAFSRKDHPEAHAAIAKICSPHRPPTIVEECDSAMSLIAAVENGRGVALVYQSLSFVAGRRVVLRPLKPEPPPLAIAVAYRADGISSAAAGFFAASRTMKLKRYPGPALSA